MKNKLCLPVLLLLLLVYSCRKNDPAPLADQDTPSLSAIISDTAFSVTDGKGNISTSGFYFTHYSMQDYSSAFESMFLNDTAKVFTATLGCLHHTSSNGIDTVSNNDFYNYITVGNYSYTDLFSSLRAVEITFTDLKTRKVFSSAKGSQQSASFNITSVQRLIYRGTAAVRVNATFNCTVYTPKGEHKVITNGALRMYFQNH